MSILGLGATGHEAHREDRAADDEPDGRALGHAVQLPVHVEPDYPAAQDQEGHQDLEGLNCQEGHPGDVLEAAHGAALGHNGTQEPEGESYC